MQQNATPPSDDWVPWLIGGLVVALAIIVLIFFVIIPYSKSPSKTSPPMAPFTIPTGACRCYSDTTVRTPGSSPASQDFLNIESRDNKTFCGYEKDGYRWGCKPSDCTPSCT